MKPTLPQVVNLRGIGLTRLTASTQLTYDALPDKPPRLMLEQDASGRDRPDDYTIEVLVVFGIRGTPLPGDTEPSLLIEAQYRILYTRPSDYNATAEEIEEFAQKNGVFNAWPYWRELTHSLYGRMELPLPPIPVFRVNSGVHKPVLSTETAAVGSVGILGAPPPEALPPPSEALLASGSAPKRRKLKRPKAKR